MLQAAEFRPGDSPRRVRGRWALERRARGLLIAVHRFGRCRAATREDIAWSATWIDGLTALLQDDVREETPLGTRQERQTAGSAHESESGAQVAFPEGFRS